MKIRIILVNSFEKHAKSMTNIMVMFIASISNGLTYTGAIVADNIFWLMPNFSCDFLQYFLNSFSTPTLSDRYVYNGYVFFL